MVQGMIIKSLSPFTIFILSINKNYKLKNLLAELEKILIFLFLAFFNLD